MELPSRSMFKLRCKVGDGIFSNERLIRFIVDSGEEYTALVDAGAVQSEGSDAWIEVVRAQQAGARSLVTLPSDGTRVWVSSAELQAAV